MTATPANNDSHNSWTHPDEPKETQIPQIHPLTCRLERGECHTFTPEFVGAARRMCTALRNRLPPPPFTLVVSWLLPVGNLRLRRPLAPAEINQPQAQSVLGAFVGVDIGTDFSNMPSESDVVTMLKELQITHVRLFDADAKMLNALANTGIEVMVGVSNDEVLGIGQSPSVAADWINNNVAAYVPQTNITAIAVGSEVLTTAPCAAPALARAMMNLHTGLVAVDLNFQVKVSTPHSMDVISRPFPPSGATFDSSWNGTMYLILQFLKNTDSYLMLNAYPYYGFSDVDGLFPLEYALFQPLSSAEQIIDPNTLLHYDSMFDAMVDAAYYSIQDLNFSQIPIVVSETGWPWQGGANESYATLDNAKTYNNNLVRRVLNDSGPPSQRSMPISTYIYELFDENWGVFFSNGTSVYPLRLDGSAKNSSDVFCIAKEDADSDKLRDGMNWTCTQGYANCTFIQEGKPCYYPDNLQNHASYIYNDYYQRLHSVGGTCDFDGTATTTEDDPSYGLCVFIGSINETGNSSGFSPTAFEPVSPLQGGSSTLLPVTVCWTVGIILFSFTL